MFYGLTDLLLETAPDPANARARQARLQEARETLEKLKAAELAAAGGMSIRHSGSRYAGDGAAPTSRWAYCARAISWRTVRAPFR